MTATTIPSFNPSGDTRVTAIKSAIEAVMSYLKSEEVGDADGRCVSIALTKLEEASMWAVKSLFV